MKLKLVIYAFLFISCNVFSQINTTYWLNAGREKLIENQPSASLDYFNTVLRFVPNMHEALFLRAVAKYSLGDLRGSLSDFNQAIVHNPYSSLYYLYRADVKQQLLDLKGSADDLEFALGLNPDNPLAYLIRGINNLHQKNYETALKDFDKALKFNNKNSDAYLFRAYCKQKMGKHELALSDYNKAISLSPRKADSYLKRGVNYAEMDQHQAALEDFNYAIELNNKFSLAYFNRALTLIEKFDYMGAMNDYNMVIRLDPQNALTYYNRALLRIRINDLDSAIIDFTKVLIYSPNNVFTYFNRGILWDRKGNSFNAINDFNKAIELNPVFSSAYYYRSQIKKSVGDWYGAEKDYKKFLELGAIHQENDSAIQLPDSAYLAKLIDFKADFEQNENYNESIYEIGVQRFENIEMIIKSNENNVQVAFIKAGWLEQYNQLIFKNKPFQLQFKNKADESKILNIDNIHQLPIDDSLILQTILLVNKGNLTGAIEYVEKNIKTSSNPLLFYFLRSNIRYRYISIINSIREMPGEIKINSDFPSAPKETKRNKLSYQQVIEDLNKVLEIDSTYYPASFNMANILIEENNLDGAIKYLDDCINKEPRFSEAYFNRGLTYLYLENNTKGCADMSKAGELGIENAYQVINSKCQ